MKFLLLLLNLVGTIGGGITGWNAYPIDRFENMKFEIILPECQINYPSDNNIVFS